MFDKPHAISLTMLAALAAATGAQACSGRLHLEVGPSGVYSLDYADAVAAQPGLAGCAIDQLMMTTQGKEVPIRVLDKGAPVFDSGDRIEWVGEMLHGPESWFNPYSLVNVYELGAASGKRLRFAPQKATTGEVATTTLSRHLHLEKDRMMVRLTNQQAKQGEQADVWYWAKMTMVDPKPVTVKFDLPGMQPNFAEPQLALAFRGLSRLSIPKDQADLPDHSLQVMLNGKEIGQLQWDGEGHLEKTLSVPTGVLREKGNRLQFRVPSRRPDWAKHRLVDVIMFDHLSMTYPLTRPGADAVEAISVTRAGAPVLSGKQAPLLFGSDGTLYLPKRAGKDIRYATAPAGTMLFPLAPGHAPLTPVGLRAVADQHDWKNPGRAIDYVMIAHPSLLQAIQPLAQFHRQRGLNTVVIDVNAAYDQFNHGVVNPNAIRDLLAWAHQHWPAPAPRYVLLVGDASHDIHNTLRDRRYYAKWATRELLIPGRFGNIPGTPYKNAPEQADARNLIPTFRFYSSEGQSASDNRFVAFAEDNSKPVMAIGRLPVVTPEEVSAVVDKTITYVREPKMGPWQQSIMFITNDDKGFQNISNKLAADLGQRGFSAQKVYPASSDKDNLAHQATIRNDIDNGQLLVHFLGHGGRYIWRTGPPDPIKNHDLFTLDDIDKLNNAGKLPMVLSMTCYSAPFDNPVEDSIGEKFLRAADKGAIAVFAASWRNSPDTRFSQDLMEALVTPGLTIGDAILKAKQATSNRAMIGMYNLLGDPAVALQRPREQLHVQQVRGRWGEQVAIEVPGASAFNGELRVEWFDDQGHPLSSRLYRINSPRLVLPGIPEGGHQVRLYALDPSRRADALGELTLTPPPRKPQQRPWWMPAPKPRPLPAAADRIFGSNMGG